MPRPPNFHRESITKAIEWLNAVAVPQRIEEVPLEQANGRLLARELSADADCPTYATAAIDGYAVIADDTIGASDYSPLPFRLVDASSEIERSDAAPINAGDRLPEHATAVLPPELAERHPRGIEVSGTVAVGHGVIAIGEEFPAGQMLYGAGHRLRPQDLALLARNGNTIVPVRAHPAIHLILAVHFERDANGPMLKAAIQRDTGVPANMEHIDSHDALASALSNALANGADVTIVAGGAGRGADDVSVATLADIGDMAIYGVALNPGESTALGHVGDMPVLLLPGQPLACWCAYDMLAAYLVRRMAGRSPELPYATVQLPLARKVTSSIGQTEICRVRISHDKVEPIAVAENRLLTTATDAQGFVIVPENSEGYPAGSVVTVHLY